MWLGDGGAREAVAIEVVVRRERKAGSLRADVLTEAQRVSRAAPPAAHLSYVGPQQRSESLSGPPEQTRALLSELGPS